MTYGMAENSDDRSIALAVDKFENVYVAGTSSGDDCSSYTTIKYAELSDQWKKKVNSYKALGCFGSTKKSIKPMSS